MEGPVKVEKGKKVLIYARLAGDVVAQWPLSDIAKNPEETLKETELAFLIYVTFE